ncbi:MAG: acetyl-CoA carboxylase biotin carboxyl carrier protein subunit [Clostridia bacterium]|nr:acetyl-CoA carboxylase biotin carboxyl carrier protein subunit [Clostridia bacterium]
MRYFKVNVNGTLYEIQLQEVSADEIKNSPAQPAKEAPAKAPAAPASNGEGEQIKCPMAGTITTVNVQAGSSVKRGDVLMILEAMKMENEICAPRDGKITSVSAASGATVASGDVLCTIA